MKKTPRPWHAVVLEAYTDPSVPPLPPHISFKQAKAFAASMFKGDPDMWDVRERGWDEALQIKTAIHFQQQLFLMLCLL
jgi:hypothetical protein